MVFFLFFFCPDFVELHVSQSHFVFRLKDMFLRFPPKCSSKHSFPWTFFIAKFLIVLSSYVFTIWLLSFISHFVFPMELCFFIDWLPFCSYSQFSTKWNSSHKNEWMKHHIQDGKRCISFDSPPSVRFCFRVCQNILHSQHLFIHCNDCIEISLCSLQFPSLTLSRFGSRLQNFPL